MPDAHRFALQALDVLFILFHTGLILFNSLGWAFRRTRRANLITLGATAFSWFVMGLWWGIGYCVCTDWHWQIRRSLGYPEVSDTYIGFLFATFTPWRPGSATVEWITGLVFALSIVLSVALNVRDTKIRRPQGV